MSYFSFAVTEIVQFLRRSGDIDLSVVSNRRMQLGTIIHTVTQSKHKKNYEKNGYLYFDEVPLSFDYKFNNITLNLKGRADEILVKKDEIIINELKSTKNNLSTINFDTSHWHYLQVAIYAFIYSYYNEKKDITIQLFYIHSESYEEKFFTETLSFLDLENIFLNCVHEMYKYLEVAHNIVNNAIETGKEINFPFLKYRKNQRDLLVAVYRTIQNEKLLFAQAPTGVGKTISTLFPAIKALTEGYTDKIFYTTAKNITRTVAEDTLKTLKEKNLKLCSVTISAKEKICINDNVSCNAFDCIYAKGHFDRVNTAIMDIIQNETIITLNEIQEYAIKHTICPFEFSLDISLFAQIIICDYNYIYNPKVVLKRFFTNKSNNIILVDEAHNLDDRVCDMYSIKTDANKHIEIRNLLANNINNAELCNLLLDIENFFIQTNNNFLIANNTNKSVINYQFNMLLSLFEKIIKIFNKLFDNGIQFNKDIEKQVMDYYFHLGDFVRIFDFYNDSYKTLIKNENGNITIQYLCLNPAFAIKQINEITKSTIFFSATLSPLIYYRDIYGGSSIDYSINIDSPFPVDNSVYIVDNSINTYYKSRDTSYILIVDRLYNMIVNKVGNYLVFFSSFEYLNTIFDLFTEKYPTFDCIKQTQNMNENNRKHFLSMFNTGINSTLVGFAVLGGVFGEGIDLKGDKLIGVAVVGVGLPKITLDRNVKKDYFDQISEDGFSFAYKYPALNKVNQSIGRLIRTENDLGIVLLMDVRYSKSEYIDLIHTYGKKIVKVNNNDSLRIAVNNFWNKKT